MKSSLCKAFVAIAAVWSVPLAAQPPAPVLGLKLPVAAQAGLPGTQPVGFVPGSRELFSIDFAAEPLGEFPKRLKLLLGNMSMVMKDGVPALRASDPAQFLISLPERLPNDFTLEFDLIPKTCCNPTDLAFEGTPTQDRGPASMMVEWSPENLKAVGGGEMFQMNMPADLKAVLPGQPSEVRMSVKGTTVVLYTNGQQVFTIDRKFPRGRVLRIHLGGQDDDKYAVYLTKLRLATNSPPSP